MRASTWVTGFAVALWFAGCGGTTTQGSSGAAGTAQSYCEAESAWRERCKTAMCPVVRACAVGSPCPPETAPCETDNLLCDTVSAECLKRVFRSEALAKMRDCELQMACTASRNQCGDELTLSNPSAAAAEFDAACKRRQEECVGQITGSDGDFFCFDLSANTDEYVSIYRDCLAETCNAIRGCMDRGKFDSFCAT